MFLFGFGVHFSDFIPKFVLLELSFEGKGLEVGQLVEGSVVLEVLRGQLDKTFPIFVAQNIEIGVEVKISHLQLVLLRGGLGEMGIEE